MHDMIIYVFKKSDFVLDPGGPLGGAIIDGVLAFTGAPSPARGGARPVELGGPLGGGPLLVILLTCQ